MAPSSPPPPPPCWASRCSWRSPWSLQQFSESPSIFSSNICMRFNLGYCFWNSDNKQRNYTWCHNLRVNSWWCGHVSCVSGLGWAGASLTFLSKTQRILVHCEISISSCCRLCCMHKPFCCQQGYCQTLTAIEKVWIFRINTKLIEHNYKYTKTSNISWMDNIYSNKYFWLRPAVTRQCSF